MKILLLNTSELSGGAAIAANRLMKSLIDNDIEAKSLVLDKQTDDKNVISIQASFAKRKLAKLYFLWERVIIFVINRFSRQNLFKISIANTGFDVSKHKLVKEADIIHLHWTNQGFLSLKGLKNLMELRKPIVWTLHDMWCFTGGCHYAGDCVNYTENCGNCHFFKNPKKDDNSHVQFSRKKKIYSDALLFPVTCSQWLCCVAEKSALLKNKPLTSIPNPIDTEQFKPCSQIEARQTLGLPKDKKLILFGAANITDNRKGMSLLINVLKQLANNRKISDIELIVFGKTEKNITEKMPMPVHILNYVSNIETLINLYNAADVFVLPSLEDNLPNTVMEALACGLPVAAFQTGGVPEMINHKENGYLAQSGNESELAKGIEYLIDNDNAVFLRINARKKAETCYAPQIIAKRYEELYKSILNNGNER